jgi:hypothetical protein
MSGRLEYKYFFCAWNSRHDEELSEDDLADVLKRLLATHRFSAEVGSEEDSDLVVVLPRERDSQYSADELAVFHRGLRGKPKKVLYIHPASRIAFQDGPLCNWLFFMRNAGFDCKAFSKWLAKSLPNVSSEGDKPSAEDWLDLLTGELKDLVSFGQSDFQAWLKRKENRKLMTEICPFSPLLMEKNSIAALFFSLHRISGLFAKLEHDLRKNTSAESTLKRTILHACIGLRDAMVLGSQNLGSAPK